MTLDLLFEDRNGDGILVTESTAADPPEVEVLQRHFYYPFGLNFEGHWSATAGEGENRYQYNGKELTKDLGLGWYFYGARMHDPAVGRFTGVDPVAEEFAWVTTYNYAENEPVASIDLHGLQRFMVIYNGYGATALSSSKKSDKNVIDATWSSYHKLNPGGVVWRHGEKIHGDDGVVWKYGHDAYVKSRDRGTANKGTLLMYLAEHGVEMSYFPNYEPQNVRGGIELMTGSGLPGSGNLVDPEGTSSVIIDEIIVPFGGGAGGKEGITRALDLFTDWLGAMGNVNPDRAPISLESSNQDGTDTIFCRACGNNYLRTGGHINQNTLNLNVFQPADTVDTHINK